MIVRTLLLAAAASLTLAAPADARPSYHLLRSVTVGGDTFWDAITLDPVDHHLFLTHGSHVVVLDSRSYAPAGDIADVAGAHQVAVGLGKGFATSGASDSVVAGWKVPAPIWSS